MTYALLHRPQVEKQIISLHPLLKKEVRMALDFIEESPQDGKPLVEELKGFYSWKVKKHRTIYQINGKFVEIVAFGHRSSIYDFIEKDI